MKLQQRVKSEVQDVVKLTTMIVQLMIEHKKKALLIVIFEIWVHGQAFHHISEFKSIMDLFHFY